MREYGFHPRTKASVSDGALLPRKFEPFPENMYGRPLEEIDTFIYEEVRWFRRMLIDNTCYLYYSVSMSFAVSNWICLCFMFYAFTTKLMLFFLLLSPFHSVCLCLSVIFLSFFLSLSFLSPQQIVCSVSSSIHIGWVLLRLLSSFRHFVWYRNASKRTTFIDLLERKAYFYSNHGAKLAESAFI